MWLLMLVLAVMPSAPLRAQSVRPGQVLARLKTPSTGEYSICWELKKPAGAWSATLRHLERRDQKTQRGSVSIPNLGGKQVNGCTPNLLHLTAGEVVLLRSEAAFTGAIIGTLRFQGDASP